MYPRSDIDKEIQDLWSFVFRIKNGGVTPASIFGTWFNLGAGVNGAVGFANSPFTPAASSPFVLYPVDTTGGVVRVNTPSGTLQDGQVIFFKDIAGNFGVNPMNFVANNGGGETVEEEQQPGTFGAQSNLTTQGMFQGYKFQLASKRWIGWIGF